LLFSPVPYYPTLSLILVHSLITPKIKALAIPLLMSSTGRRLSYFPFCRLPRSGHLHKFKYRKCIIAILSHCKKSPISAYSSRTKEKELSNWPDPLQYSMSQTRVVPLPSHPSHFPFRKSSNIYIFNPIKNVEKKYVSALRPHSSV